MSVFLRVPTSGLVAGTAPRIVWKPLDLYPSRPHNAPAFFYSTEGMTLKTARLVFGVICLALLTGSVVAGADGADQLYEFKMKGQAWTDIVDE